MQTKKNFDAEYFIPEQLDKTGMFKNVHPNYITSAGFLFNIAFIFMAYYTKNLVEESHQSG